MPKPMLHAFLAVAVLAAALPARAQDIRPEVSVGPQLTTLGLGLGLDVRLIPQLSLSAEYGFLPAGLVPESDQVDAFRELLDLSENEISVEPGDLTVRGGLLAVNLHPLGGKFALGFGVFLGGYAYDAVLTPAEPIEIGDETYTPEEIGRVSGDFSLGDTAGAVYLGWRGRGFHFGAGIATRAPSDVAVTASGPISGDPVFQRELDKEVTEIENELEKLRVLPFVRLGWQFRLM